ncbi:tetratricopeptide repeat protein [Atopomonas hussainii]|uniref:tetratricopeptide repeat protein n=1 Tax=Atopomonas hussainii TaxID=1429083 RepID=UPI0008FFE695|nr:tetratricopeptide repeat protein [Atopomonas hussainii]
MSLVNEMLRDLEARRASPEETAPFAGMAPVDDDPDERLQDRLSRKRPLLAWLGGCALLAILLGMSLKVIFDPAAKPASAPAVVQAPTPVAPAVMPAPALAQIQAVLPQNQGERFVLQLLLDKPVSYERKDEDGAISIRLPATALPQGLQQGRVQRAPLVLSWRLEPQGNDVQLLLVALGGTLQVDDRLESAADRWQLWLEVTPRAAEAELDITDLPVAEEASEPVELFAVPVSAPPAEPALQSAARATNTPPAVRAQPTANTQIKVTPRRQDELSRAKQAMLAQDYLGAISLLEAAQREQPDNSEVSAWLAKAYLAAGQINQLQSWLPGQIARQPQNSELRMLLARGQLEQGQAAAAAQTLSGYLPPLAKDPAYHALLAATYQQTGNWAQSAERYQELLRYQAGQGSWQLGLAIALEQLGDLRTASNHYRLGLATGSLQGASADYARSRLAALLKELGDE